MLDSRLLHHTSENMAWIESNLINSRPCLGLLLLFLFQSAAHSSEIPLNPDVRQETLNQTICVTGWTKTVRPPASHTGPIKRQMMAEIGVPPEGEDTIKLDHRIPLALGGSPDSLANFMLQPDDESKDKDRVEVCLARMVCAGKLSLSQAQAAIWANWQTAAALCSGYKVI